MKRKRCGRCKKTRLIKFFHVDRAKGGYQCYCIDCRRAYYHENAIRIKKQAWASNKERIERNRQGVLTILKEKSCMDCGEEDHVVLEFDHVRGKKYGNISRMIANANGWEKILEEIAKCDVVCANCHRRRSYQRSGCYRLEE